MCPKLHDPSRHCTSDWCPLSYALFCSAPTLQHEQQQQQVSRATAATLGILDVSQIGAALHAHAGAWRKYGQGTDRISR